LDRQRNADIRNGLNVTAPYIRKYKTAQTQPDRSPKQMDGNRQPRQRIDMGEDRQRWKDQGHLELYRTDPRPKPR